MKMNFKIVILFCMVVFFSCKKSGDSNVPFAPPSSLTPTASLKAVHTKDTLAGNAFINRLHSYYTYNSSGLITQVVKYDSLYDYSTNSILQSSNNEAFHFTYLNSKLAYYKRFYNNVYLDSSSYKFDTQNRIQTVYNYTISAGVATFVDSTGYTYLNNEVDLYSFVSTNSQDFLFDSNSGIIKVITGLAGTYSIQSYVNDQYQNPYYKLNFLIQGVASKTNPVSKSSAGVLTNYSYLRNSTNAVTASHYSASSGNHGYSTFVY